MVVILFEFILSLDVGMEVSDKCLALNRDLDPAYLSTIFDVDFHDFNELWPSPITDKELVMAGNDVEKYCPIVGRYFNGRLWPLYSSRKDRRQVSV